jgi:predicted permease
MLDTLLIIHFFGLTISAGTGFYLAAMGSYAAKHIPREQIKPLMLGPGGAISNLGFIGLIIMICSGLAMVGLLLADETLVLGVEFYIKMALVASVTGYVLTMRRLAHKAKDESGPGSMITIKKFSPVGWALGVMTIAASVMTFH